MAVISSELEGTTHGGDAVSFSYEAYTEAMKLYSIGYLERQVKRIEKGRRVRAGVADFLRDFLIIQETIHPDHDRGIAIGSLATRIELATGQVTPEELEARGIDVAVARREYDLVFAEAS